MRLTGVIVAGAAQETEIEICVFEQDGVTWLRIVHPDSEKPLLIGLPSIFLDPFLDAIAAIGIGVAKHSHIHLPVLKPVLISRCPDPNLN